MSSFILLSRASFIAALMCTASLAQDAGWREDALARAARHHRENSPKMCKTFGDELSALRSYQLQIGEESAARQALLVQFPCNSDVARQSSVFLLSDQHGTVSEVLFHSPFIVNQGEIDVSRGPARSQVRIDWRDKREVINAQYDESGRTMVEVEKWSGPGEAYNSTQWGYRDGRFQLMRFVVDASRDGRDNPELLIESQLW